MRKTGHYHKEGSIEFFIPHSLPPTNPPLKLTPEITTLYGEALSALGKLDEMSLKLPDTERFIKAYVIKEALLSSAIEGIHTTLIDVFTHTLGESQPNKETQLVLNYTKALNTAQGLLRNTGLPLVERVITQTHEVLLSYGEGNKSTPGLYRKHAVRVGDLVPPPAQEIPRLMRELKHYMNETTDLPPLIKAGLVHVQFETIHPFLDGNGRIGRMLIVLMLINNGLLRAPIVYPSYYFKKNRLEYYQKLDAVRTEGDFEGWVIYYVKAIRDSAIDAYKRAKEIEELEANLKEIIQHNAQFSKMRATAHHAVEYLFRQPIAGIAQLSEGIGKTYNTGSTLLKKFVACGIVAEDNTRKRGKLYRFDSYLTLLDKEY